MQEFFALRASFSFPNVPSNRITQHRETSPSNWPQHQDIPKQHKRLSIATAPGCLPPNLGSSPAQSLAPEKGHQMPVDRLCCHALCCPHALCPPHTMSSPSTLQLVPACLQAEGLLKASLERSELHFSPLNTPGTSPK